MSGGRQLPERAEHHPGVLGQLGEGPWHFHVVGAGGAGMSAIAGILLALGHRVSGSDEKSSAALERLAAAGARTWVGHRAEHVHGADAVVYSSAITPANAELTEARGRGTPVFTRSEVLSAICSLKRTLAVSGTHGKTTTTAMLAVVLEACALSPSYLVGGEMPGGDGGARWSAGDLFVVEADESDGTFLSLPAFGVLVTSVEPDHMDFFGDVATLREAFRRFVRDAGDIRVVCLSGPSSTSLAREAVATGVTGVVTYGPSGTGADFEVRDVRLEGFGSSFEIAQGNFSLGRFNLQVPGMHNVLDATGAMVMASAIGAPVRQARSALASFPGVGRRFEIKGEAGGVVFVDDYAHNPGKVAALLAAAKAAAAGRVVAVFQPHRYSRTAALWRELGEALGGADLVIVTDIYGAGEPAIANVSSELVVQAARQASPATPVLYLPTRPDLLQRLPEVLEPGDLCLTIGAGDITTLAPQLMKLLSQ